MTDARAYAAAAGRVHTKMTFPRTVPYGFYRPGLDPSFLRKNERCLGNSPNRRKPRTPPTYAEFGDKKSFLYKKKPLVLSSVRPSPLPPAYESRRVPPPRSGRTTEKFAEPYTMFGHGVFLQRPFVPRRPGGGEIHVKRTEWFLLSGADFSSLFCLFFPGSQIPGNQMPTRSHIQRVSLRVKIARYRTSCSSFLRTRDVAAFPYVYLNLFSLAPATHRSISFCPR